MTRKEIFQALLTSGAYHRPKKDHPLWISALQEYKKDSGDERVSLSCGTCVVKIKKWLER